MDCERTANVSTMEIGLSLGSNLEDRIANLSEAKGRIAEIDGVTVVDQSPVYETDPVGVPAAFRNLLFLNAVIIIESALDPRELLHRFCIIEEHMGRHQQPLRNAPRPIDIDIIYAGHKTLADDDIHIPHPRWAERAFVVKPLSDVRPDLQIPGTRRSIQEVLLSLPDAEKLVPFTVIW